jgi:hypothetical protein
MSASPNRAIGRHMLYPVSVQDELEMSVLVNERMNE